MGGGKLHIAGLLIALGLSACESSSALPSPAITATPTACPGGRNTIESAVTRFVDDWNSRDESGVKKLFTADAELDMSTSSQGASQADNYSTVVGNDAVAQFALNQWATGESLSFSSINTFNGGAYVVGMSAKFGDGRQQVMNDAKFVYAACRAAFNHVVIVAKSPAT